MIRVFDKHTPQGKIYGTNYTHFDTLGNVIRPISAYITEELNGEYSYEVTCPIVEGQDSWKALLPYSIIRATTGQLFQINKLTYSTQNGVPCVTAYAPHIWYYLSDMLLRRYEDSNYPFWALHDMMMQYDEGRDVGTEWSNDDQCTNYTFESSIAVDGVVRTFKFKNVSLAYAILGSPDSIVNQCKAYLYRDNFRFSINSDRLEGSVDNAFELNVADNCKEIKYTEDHSEKCSDFRAYHQDGSYWGINFPSDRSWAHRIYHGADISAENLQEIMYNYGPAYWADHNSEKKSYDVTFVDSYGTERNTGWERLRTMKVGDSGRITDLRGETDVQTIISTRYNDITGRIDNLKLGKFIRSALHQTRWDKIKSGDSAAFRRLDIVEKKADYFKLVKGG